MSRPVCLVTGSSSGIGAEIVRQFAAQGYDVVVNYNSGADRAEQIAAEIRAAHDVEVAVLGADLAQAQAPFSLVDDDEHVGAVATLARSALSAERPMA